MDNWKHRSTGMRCCTCMWFVAKVRPEPRTGKVNLTGDPEIERAIDIGRCRRHAPTLGGWPAIYESDWCGDHKIDESKI